MIQKKRLFPALYRVLVHLSGYMIQGSETGENRRIKDI
jgi:hypothetical protein